MSEPSKIPTLKTKRLILRPFTLSDAKEVQRQAGSPEVAATTSTIPHPYPDGAAEEWISQHADWYAKGLAADWAIELIETKKLIGCISLGINKTHKRAELGYWIGKENWNKGFGSEAAKETIRFAFENLKLNKVAAKHMSGNPGSEKVMIKAGMEKEGHLKQDFRKGGQFVDMVLYGILKKNF